MSSPSKRTAPAVGSIRRSTRRPVVDLPQPDSPTSASVSPRAISKLTSSTARTRPTALRRIRPRLTPEMLDQAVDLQDRDIAPTRS